MILINLFSKEIELLTKSNQAVSEKSILEGELQSSKARQAYLEEQISTLNNEVQRLRQESYEKSSKINELTIKASLIDDREVEIQAWRSRYDEFERQSAQDIERLHASLANDKEVEIQAWRSRYDELERQTAQDIQSLHASLINDKEEEIQAWRSRYDDLERQLQEINNNTGEREAEKNTLEQQVQGYQIHVTDIENRLIFLQEENRRLLQVNIDTRKELDDLKFKHSQTEQGVDNLKRSLTMEMKTQKVSFFFNYIKNKGTRIF